MINQRHEKEIRKFVANGDFELTDGGILVHDSMFAIGTYYHDVDGEDRRHDHNLLTAESIGDILDVYFGATAKHAALYLSLFSGNATPDSAWTAANYPANATENTSTTEGFSGSNRPEWVDAPQSGGIIGNIASTASFAIVCTTTVDFYGAALHSVQTRGAVTGKIASASRFSAKRTLNNGATFNLGYTVELTDS